MKKIYDYCLNPHHERGQHKAKIFKHTFGITYQDGELLKSAILAQLDKSEVTQISKNSYGTKYTLPLKISIFGKGAEVMTAWIIYHDDITPQLITCYVNK